MSDSNEKALRDFLANELMPAIFQKGCEAKSSGSQTSLAFWRRCGESVRALKESLDAVLTPMLTADEEDLDQVRLRDLAEGNTFRNCGDVLLSLSGDPDLGQDLTEMIREELAKY